MNTDYDVIVLGRLRAALVERELVGGAGPDVATLQTLHGEIAMARRVAVVAP